MKVLKISFIVLGCLSLLGLICFSVLYFLFPTPEAKFKKYEDKRNQIVVMIQNGTLKSDASGVVSLPQDFEETTVFGKAFVAGSKDSFRVDFPLSKKKDDFDVFVYCQGNEMPEVKNRFGNLIPVHKMREHWFYADSMEIYAKTY